MLELQGRRYCLLPLHRLYQGLCICSWLGARADSGAPTYSRNRGWWSCSTYAGSTSATSALSYDVIRYGQHGRPSDISRMSPVSDVASCTSKGPSQDKSPDVGIPCVPVSSCDSPTTETKLSPRAVSCKSEVIWQRQQREQ